MRILYDKKQEKKYTIQQQQKEKENKKNNKLYETEVLRIDSIEKGRTKLIEREKEKKQLQRWIYDNGNNNCKLCCSQPTQASTTTTTTTRATDNSNNSNKLYTIFIKRQAKQKQIK